MIVIVAGLGHCGSSLAMAMLIAGGMSAAGAGPPFFEKPEAAHAILPLLREFVPPRGKWVVSAVMAILPPTIRNVGGGISPAWFASIEGQAVKILNPHLLSIPSGNHRAIWLDRNEQDRATTAIRYTELEGDRPGLREHLVSYYSDRRDVARDALLRAGSSVIDVNYEDLVGSPDRCRAAVDRIADFVGLPLSRDAMVERAAEYIRQADDVKHRLSDHWPRLLRRRPFVAS